MRGEFPRLINTCRENLARHYLCNTRLPGYEIAFLLGFEDPNSFLSRLYDLDRPDPERSGQSGTLIKRERHDKPENIALYYLAGASGLVGGSCCSFC
jgi:AraC-like DNA-binding protein